MCENCRWRRETRELGKSRGGSFRFSGGPAIVLLRLQPSLGVWRARSAPALSLVGVFRALSAYFLQLHRTSACLLRLKGLRFSTEIPQSLSLSSTRVYLQSLLRHRIELAHIATRDTVGHELSARSFFRALKQATFQHTDRLAPHGIGRR